MIHRKIDFEKDREYVLERHCRINYECDTPWKRELPYEEYRRCGISETLMLYAEDHAR